MIAKRWQRFCRIREAVTAFAAVGFITAPAPADAQTSDWPSYNRTDRKSTRLNSSH